MPEWRTVAQVPAEHPCLAGHFPGNPVVPGVVLLDLVLGAMRTWQGAPCRLRRLLTTKFLLPLRPDERFDIVLRLRDARLEWRCERQESLLAHGNWELEF